MASEKRLIDADAIFPNGVFYVNGSNPMTSLDELINRINNAPTVDAVEVVHGRWIIGTGENALMRGYRMCSVCGEIIKTQYSLYGMLNYCPNCGAKMDGERKDNG